jgi:hypothetical protein
MLRAPVEIDLDSPAPGFHVVLIGVLIVALLHIVPAIAIVAGGVILVHRGEQLGRFLWSRPWFSGCSSALGASSSAACSRPPEA